MRKSFKIIFAAEQRGGLDIFLPIIEKIKNRKFTVLLFSDNKNIYRFARNQKIKCRLLTDSSFSNIEKIIKKINPDIVFADTNDSDFKFSIAKKFIVASKKLNKKTVIILDSWDSYQKRLGSSLPNTILAIDRKMKDDLEKLGIPQAIIKITGSPRFDILSGGKKVKERKNLVIFYSQPLSRRNLHELQIFRDIVGVLEGVYPEKEIIIKFHPTKENDEKNRKKYDHIIKNSILKIKKAGKQEDSKGLAQKAELTIGMNSIALVDASLMGKRVVSYQPGKNKKNDTLLSNKNGWSFPVYKKEKLDSALRNIFRKPLAKKEEFEKYTRNNSTYKVINFINNILKNGS